MWKTGKTTNAYGIFLDLSGGQAIIDVCKFDSEFHFNEVIDSLKTSYSASLHKPDNYHEVGIKTADGKVENISFQALRARLFQK